MSNEGNGIIDETIFEATDDDFALRNKPVFGTAEDETGRVHLVVEEHDGTHTGALGATVTWEEPNDVLASLGDQEPPEAAVALNANGSPEDGFYDSASPEAPDTPTGNLTHNNQSNRPADPEEMRRDFFKDVNKFGKASGEGASALGRLGLRSLRAAADGILSVDKPPKGQKDDATLVYEAYAAMDSKHAEHTAGGAKANASKLRQIIGMGCMTTISDPVAIGDRVVTLREQMEEADLKPKALFAALVDVARDQQASDTELTDDAIREALTKTKADKTLEKEWAAIDKRIEDLITGEGPARLKDDSDAAHKIKELVGEHCKGFMADGTRKARIDDMVTLGYTVEQAKAIVDKKIAL